jgi:hypothetical protein
MHAVFVQSQIDADRTAEAEAMLRDVVAPMVRQAPGLVSATWARSADGTEGRSVAIFDSEEAAQAMLGVVRGIPAGAPVRVVGASMLEVVLQL